MNSYYEQYWTEKREFWTPSAGSIGPNEQSLVYPHLKPGAIVLDYGCGDGQRYGHELSAREVRYVGFDVSAAAVQRACDSGLNASLLVEGFRTTVDDASCDVAICFEVLEHLMEPDVAVREIGRALREGGVAIFSVPNSASWFQRLEFLATGFWNPGGSPLTSRKAPWRDPHIRFFSPKLLRRILLENGFSEVRVTGSDFNLQNVPYLYRARRLGAFARLLSFPLRWLGYAFPGLFCIRIFATARKQRTSAACGG